VWRGIFAPLVTRKPLARSQRAAGASSRSWGPVAASGATTIAGNLAWLLGVMAKRHTVFSGIRSAHGLRGSAARRQNRPRPAHGARNPDRIDPLFVERAAQPVSERLQVLASEEKLNEPLNYAPGAARRLIETLRVRYNFIIMDVPSCPCPANRELIEFAHHRIIIMDPSLASVRDTLRLLAFAEWSLAAAKVRLWCSTGRAVRAA